MLHPSVGGPVAPPAPSVPTDSTGPRHGQLVRRDVRVDLPLLGQTAPARALGLLLVVVVASLLAVVVVFLSRLPWMLATPPGWLVPVAIVGLVCGLVVARVTTPARMVGPLLPLVGASALPVGLAALVGLGAGVTVAAPLAVGALTRAALGPLALLALLARADAGILVTSLVVVGLGVGLPWLALRLHVWPAVALVWFLVVGASRLHDALDGMRGASETGLEAWWVVVLLGLSVAALGTGRLREDALRWDAQTLGQVGAVFRPALGLLARLAVGVALLGLLPLGALSWPALTTWLGHHQPWPENPVIARSQTGPVNVLASGRLVLGAPFVVGDAPVAHYTVLGAVGPGGQPLLALPPIVATGLDHFDGWTWQRSSGGILESDPEATLPSAPTTPGGGTVSGTPPPGLPQGAGWMEVRFTLGRAAPTGPGAIPLLLGFGEPRQFSGVVWTSRIPGSGGGDPLGILGYVGSTGATTYTEVSAILDPATLAAAPAGGLSPDVAAALTELPLEMAQTLAPVARGWLLASQTPLDAPPAVRAQALAAALAARITVGAAPPAAGGSNPVVACLSARRCPLDVATSLYIALGRSIGLPLELAEGYLPGTPEPGDPATSAITARDATVWARLALGSGDWEDLFPLGQRLPAQIPNPTLNTAGGHQGAAQAPSAAAPANTAAHHPPTPEATSGSERSITSSAVSHESSPMNAALGGLFGLLILGLLMVALLVLLVARLFLPERSLVLLFRQIARFARWGGVPLRPSDTSRQAAAKVGVAVPARARLVRWAVEQFDAIQFGGAPTRILPLAQVVVLFRGVRSLPLRRFARRLVGRRA